MTLVTRYVQHTIDGAGGSPNVSSTGVDHQCIYYDLTTTTGIAAGADEDIFVWEGAGKIKSCNLIGVKVIATGEIIPFGVVATDTHSLLELSADGKTINLSVPAAGVAVPADSVLSLVVVIGAYS